MQGTIKKTIPDRGFGFIDIGEEDDIFFHQTNLPEDVSISELRVGQAVEFDIEDTDKGPNALNIVLVDE